MMTFHLLNLNQQLTTLLIASIIFKQIIVNSFKNIYQIYAYIYKSLEQLQNIQISTRSFKKMPLSLRSVRWGIGIEHSLQSIAQLVKTHFTNCPLTFGSHDIGWIELGSIWAVFDSRLPLRYQKLPIPGKKNREKSEATERVF